VKRSHGSGHLYVKHGSYYGRWRGVDGRLVNNRIGPSPNAREKDGITRTDAERGLRRLVEAERRQPPPPPTERSPSVDDVADELRARLAVEGARLSYRQNCESIAVRPHLAGHRHASRGQRHAPGRRAACALDAQARPAAR
jgi:hypothetical protein